MFSDENYLILITVKILYCSNLNDCKDDDNEVKIIIGCIVNGVISNAGHKMCASYNKCRQKHEAD